MTVNLTESRGTRTHDHRLNVNLLSQSCQQLLQLVAETTSVVDQDYDDRFEHVVVGARSQKLASALVNATGVSRALEAQRAAEDEDFANPIPTKNRLRPDCMPFVRSHLKM